MERNFTGFIMNGMDCKEISSIFQGLNMEWMDFAEMFRG